MFAQNTPPNTNTKIMNQLLEGFTDSEVDPEKNLDEISPIVSIRKNTLVHDIEPQVTAEHPLVRKEDDLDSKIDFSDKKHNLSNQIHQLCKKSFSKQLSNLFYKHPHIDINPPITLEALKKEKEKKDHASLRKRIQHEVFSFFTIMPTDTWKGIACNITFWGMQTAASLWTAKNCYQGLYGWYNESDIDQNNEVDITMKILCGLPAVFLFWLTQKGIGAGIQHYKLFKSIIDSLQQAIASMIHSFYDLEKTQKVDSQEIERMKKRLSCMEELIKILLPPVVEQEIITDDSKRKIIVLLHQLKEPPPLQKQESLSSLSISNR
jgi:hypothetical protein